MFRNKDILALYFIALVASFYLADLRQHLNREFTTASLQELVSFKAATPFQYRVLVPLSLRLCIKSGLTQLLPAMTLLKLMEAFSIFGFFICMHHYLILALKNIRSSGICAFLVFLLIPFHFFLYPTYFYPSDMTSLFFFTAGLYLLRTEKWAFFYPLFILATLNRETTIFLIFIFLAANFGKKKAFHLFLHSGCSILLWTGIKLGLNYYFADNPGRGVFESHMAHNLKVLTSPEIYPTVVSSFGFLWILLIIFKSQLHDEFINRSFLVFIPLISGMFLVGNLDEIRIFAEMIPIVISGIATIIVPQETRY